MAHTLHVVSHTHWDREWYLPFQRFRMRLVDLIDHLLALLDRDPEFRYFSLDAQTIVLEDYLAIRPQNRAKLEGYVRDGRITVGPWYQLNDEYLTSGEATIRSLLIGHRIAERFGACQKIGYLPDQFGNISQMPQILRGFGIDNAIMGRGRQLVGDRKMEFIWEGPDGSEVTASLMAFWYNNAQRFPAAPDAAVSYATAIRDAMAPKSAVSDLLLMNGVDHLEAQEDLAPILAAIGERAPEGISMRHATLPQYMDSVKAEVAEKGTELERHVGELREDRGGSCLAGVLSTRMYLKQANHHAQITLERRAEPFASFAMLVGAEYPHDFLTYAWKLLMENHPHDSICGCSDDHVHREMVPRFEQVEQVGAELVERALAAIAPRVAAPAGAATTLVVFNSLGVQRVDPVTATVAFPLSDVARGLPDRDESRLVRGFTLTDSSGAVVPFVVRNAEAKLRTITSPVELPHQQWVQEYTIEFLADAPPCGYASYAVTQCATMPSYPALTGRDALLYAHDELDLRDGGLALEDVGDVGDEYLHRKPTEDQRVVVPLLAHAAEQSDALLYRRRWELRLSLPARADQQRRATERVECPVTVTETIYRGLPRVEYTVEVDNRARDHRLRLILGRGVRPESVASSVFDAIERPWPAPLVEEGASSFCPQGDWVDFNGVTIVNDGTPEYEVYEEAGAPHHALAVTLLRCVGKLSGGGEPGIATPDAQCLGRHTFRFARYAHAGDWDSAASWQQADRFNTPLVAVQTAPGAKGRDLPAELSFITVAPDALQVSAIKRAEDHPRTLIVRLFNPSTHPVQAARVALPGAVAAHTTDLNEQPLADLALDGRSAVTLPEVGAKKLVTLAFEV